MKSKITLKISIVVLSVFALYLIPFKAHSQLVIANGGKLVIGSGSYVVAGKGVKNTNTANDAIKLSGILRIVSGDFTNKAASGSLLSGSTGTVEFTGSAAQAINGSRATYFNNLLINNTSAAGITHTSVQSFVSGVLTLTDGVINTSAGHELVMQAGSSYTGGSDASYIEGPMSKVGSAADASAMLDIKSTSGGLLIPRMDNTALNNIASPPTSLMVYNTSMSRFYYYDGSNWVELSSSSSSGTTLYHGNGTLQGYRVVDLDNHTLSFRNSAPNNGIYITVGGNEKNNNFIKKLKQ